MLSCSKMRFVTVRVVPTKTQCWEDTLEQAHQLLLANTKIRNDKKMIMFIWHNTFECSARMLTQYLRPKC